MFNILGRESLYLDIPAVFKARMLELCGEGEEVVKGLLERSEVQDIMNGTTEEHTFFIQVPKEYTPEQIQLMCDSALAILSRTVETVPCIDVDGVRQKYQVVITNWEEPEIIGLRKTPGMSSGEVFKPIIQGLDAPGRANSSFSDQFF